MKRTMLSLLVAGLFAGIGTSAIAQNTPAANQPADTLQTRLSPESDSNSQQPAKSAKETNADKGDVTAQKPAESAKQTNPDKADDAAPMNGPDGAKPAKDFVGDSSDQPKNPKY